MKKYILKVNLPDAHKGAEVIWDENANAYYYNKSAYISPHNKTYLTAGQVTQSPDFFEEVPQEDIKDSIINECKESEDCLLTKHDTKQCMEKYAENLKDKLVEEIEKLGNQTIQIRTSQDLFQRQEIINLIRSFKA